MKGKEFKNNETVIELKDGKHKIAVDFNTFESLEEIYGSMQAAFEQFNSDSTKFKDIKKFLAAGLNSCIEDETQHVTPYELGKLLIFSKMSEYTTILVDLMNRALIETDIDEDIDEDTDGIEESEKN